MNERISDTVVSGWNWDFLPYVCQPSKNLNEEFRNDLKHDGIVAMDGNVYGCYSLQLTNAIKHVSLYLLFIRIQTYGRGRAL